MIKPSNGRIVLVTPNDRATVNTPEFKGQRLAAIVTHVWHDRLINVAVLDADGVPWSRTSVPLLQDDDVPPNLGCYAEWMDYQKGQAAKTEQIEKQLAR